MHLVVATAYGDLMNAKALVGLLCLASLSYGAVVYVREAPWARSLRERLTDYAMDRKVVLQARFAKRPFRGSNVPVYTREGEFLALAGKVTAIERRGEQWMVTMTLDPTVTRRFESGTRARAMAPRGDLIWVGKALLTPDLRAALIADLTRLWEHEGEATMMRLQPFVERLFGEVVEVLKATLPDVLEKNRDKMNDFLTVLREEIYPGQLEPALQEVLFPRLEERITKVAGSIMSEVAGKIEWGDALGVGWSAAMNKIGLGDQKTVEAKLVKILKKSALPVFQARAPELAQAAMETTAEAMQEEKVKAALDQAAQSILSHRTFKVYIAEISHQWFLENEALHRTLLDALDGEDLRTPLDDLWRRAEPILERYLEDMLTTDGGKAMNHQLVRVLRRTVLFKDRRYILLEAGAGDALVPGESVLVGEIGHDL